MYKEIEIKNITLSDWNYKKNNDIIQSQLNRNIEKNGFIQNIIVRHLGKGKYEVVDGHHRLKALKFTNSKKAMCYNLGKISLKKAQLLAIQLNEIRYKNNEYKLGKLILEMNENGTLDLETIPYNELMVKTYEQLVEDIENPPTIKKDKGEWIGIARLFRKAGYNTSIKKEIGNKFLNLLKKLMIENDLTESNSFQVLDIINAELINYLDRE